MTPTDHLVAFVAMAAAIIAILVIGTLAAADILHVGRRRRGSGTSAPAGPADLPASPTGKSQRELAATGPGQVRAGR